MAAEVTVNTQMGMLLMAEQTTVAQMPIPQATAETNVHNLSAAHWVLLTLTTSSGYGLGFLV